MSNKKPLPPYLENLKSLIANDHNHFITEVTTMDWKLINEHPFPDTWSVLEIVDHVRQGEAVMGQIVEELVEEGHQQGLLLLDEPSEEYLQALTFDFFLPEDKFCSPRELLPSGQGEMAALLQELSQARQKTLELLHRMTRLDLIAITREHPHLGVLHLYHWIRLLGLHQERHLRQIRRIRQTLESGAALA